MRQVLFLCTGNSACSQVAEAIVNSRGDGLWRASSAGTRPPARLDEFRGCTFDLVVTLCGEAAGECPAWPGQGRQVHLGFPDPAGAGTLEAFRSVRDQIARQVGELLTPPAPRQPGYPGRSWGERVDTWTGTVRPER